MAGTISLSLSQQLDKQGRPLSGGRLYVYAAGTVATPQNAYSDSALTLVLPNPITLDSAGRLPQFFLADGAIKIRLTDSAGVVQIDADNILVVGASSGSGSGASIDATTIFDTGDLKVRYATGSHTGWVRANGRTIGSATSGASERANADCEDLFVHLWGEDENLTVSGGRGATAAADWAANKTIALPDWRGRFIAGLDDMGGTAAGRLTSSYFGATATTLGASGGSEKHTLTVAQLAAHSHDITDPGHTHGFTDNYFIGQQQSEAGGAFLNGQAGSVADTTASSVTGITIDNAGGGEAHNNVPPAILATIYQKL